MAQNGGQIKYGIGFDVDTSSLNKLKQSLSEIKRLTATEIQNMNIGMGWEKANESLDDIRKNAVKVEAALEKAFNKDLGTINVAKFNKELKNLDLNKIHSSFAKAGAAGQNAFRSMTTEILTTNMQLKQSHTLINRMAETMANTVKWGIASSIMNSFTGSVQKAYGYVKNLDSSLNDIRIVTGKSAEEMDVFAVKANKAAKALGQSTRNYTDASLIYYQQGLAEQDVQARAETTLKAANVTKQSGEAVSEQLTAVWNGYKVSAQEAELYVDKLAAVAASTATDLEELSVGMGKVASAANAMGVDIDQLNGHLATVISVTRQAPESVGTAFKTIYARMSDLKLGGTDEDGLGLGDVSGTMEAMGIQVLDQTGNLRDMGEVMEDVAAKWDTWTEAQKTAMAQVMAGKRQYNNLMALFENWDMYEEAVNTSANAMGTLQNQQDIYMESTEAHLQGLSTSMEDLYDSILDEGTINTVADSLAGLADLAGNFVDAIGGGQGILLNFGSIAARVFSRQIAGGIATSITNLKGMISNTKQLSAETEILQQFKDQAFKDKNDPYLRNLIEKKQQTIELRNIMSEAQQNEANDIIKLTNELQNQKQAWDENVNSATDFISKASGMEKIDLTNEELLKDKDNAELQDRYQKASDDLEIYDNKIKDHKGTLEALNKTLKNVAKLEDNAFDEEGTVKVTKSYKNLSTAIGKTHPQMEKLIKLSKELGIAEKERTELIGKKAVFMVSKDKTPEQMRDIISAYDDLVSAMEAKGVQARDIIDRQSDGFGNSINEKIEATNQTWDNFTANLKLTQTIKGFLDIAASIGQITGAMQTLAGIKNILTDDSLSAGEKFLQVTSALAMAIPQLVTGFGGMTSALGNLITAFRASSAATGVDTVLTEANTVAKTKGAAASKAGAVAVKLFGNSFKTALPWVLAITAAITALVGIIGWLVDAWNADAKAAKDAREAAESANKAYEDTVKTANQVKDSIDKLADAEKTLNSLKKGTDEWRDALDEVNTTVLELLDIMPELSKYVDTEDGQLVMSEIGRQEAKKIQEERTLEAAQIKSLSNINSYQKSAQSDLTDYRRDTWNADELETIMNYALENGLSFLNWSPEKIAHKILNYVENADEIANSILKDAESTNEFIREYNNQRKYQDAEEAERLSLALLKLNEDKEFSEYSNSGVKDSIAKSYSNRLKEETDKKYEEKWKSEDLNELREIFANKMGAESYEEKENGVTSFKINGVEEEWSEAALRMAFASDEAAEELINFAQEAIKATENIVNSDNRKDSYKTTAYDEIDKQAVASFAGGQGGDLSSLTGDELSGLPERVKQWNISDIDADTLGYESADAFINAFLNEIKAESELRENMVQDGVKERYKEQATEAGYDISETVNGMAGLDTVLENFSSKASEYSRESLESALSNIDVFDILAKNTSAEEFLDETRFNEELDNAIKEEIEKQEKAIRVEENYKKDETKEFGFDIEEDEFRDLTEYIQDIAKESDELADSLEEDEEAAQDVARALLRYDKALESVQENYEDWMHILENGTIQEQAGIMDDLKNSYGNLLDLDTSVFSDSFLRNTDNLRLFEQAAKGSEEAYNSLYDAAINDIYVAANIDKSEWDAKINALKQDIDGRNFEDIEIGAKINSDALYTELNNLLAACATTTGQAQAILAEMGFDADLETITAEEQDTTQSTDLIARPEPVEYTEDRPSDAGEDNTYTAYSIKYTTEPSEPGIAKKTITAPTLRIKPGSLRKAVSPVGGNFKYKNTAHGGGSKNPSRSGGGGGGGGGGGSTPKKKTTKPKKDPRDRYRTVNNELDKLSTRLERLTKAQDRLYGADLSKNLEKQLEIIKDQAKWTQKKLDIMEEERAELQKELEKSGITFDANLEISNYDDILKAQEKNIQNLYKQRNAAAADSEQEKELDEKIAEAEEARDKLLESIERYDELIYSEMPDLQDAIVEMAQQKIEIELEKFNIKIKISLDLADAVKDWGDFERDMLKDTDLAGIGKSLVSEMGKLMSSGVAENLTSGLNNTANEIKAMNENPYTYNGRFALKDENGNVLKNEDGTVMVDEVKAMEELKEKQGDLMNHLKDIKELEEEINELYLDSIDNIGEAYDAQTENFEFINDQLEHSLNMIELIKGEEAYEEMGKVFEQQSQNYNALLKSQKEAVDYYREMMETETDPEAKEKWIEMWKDATNELNKTVEASIELLNEQYKNTINKTIKDMDEVFGGKGAHAEWEIALKKDDNYLDGVNSLYEIQALENKINEGINNTDSLSAQKRLNKLKEEELAKLREKDKLTQYDVDRANQLYEIELKKIALEEAQQNKSKMRLRRDSSGNYSYQFVADEDAQAQAQQELDEAQNKLYNMDKEEFKSRQEEFYETWEEYQDKMREYSELSYEERLAREDEFNEYFEYYQNRMVELSGNMNSIKQNLNQSTFDALSSLYEEDGRKFEELTDLEKSQLVDKLQPEFANTMAAMNTMLMGENGYAETWKKADDAINLANDTVKTGIEEIEKSLGLESGGLSDTTSDYYTSATELAKDFIEQQDIEIQNVINEKNAVNGLRTEVQLLKGDWEGVSKAANDALKASQDLREQQAKEEQERIAQEQAEREKQNNNSGGSNGGSGSGNEGGSGSSGGNGKIEVGDTVFYDSGVYTEDSYGNGTQGDENKGGKVKITYINTSGSRPYHISTLKGGDLGWVKKNQISGYDTGGYTGDWKTKDGKLAFLHEKELVLNKDDTENMLAMIKMIREIMGLGNQISTLDTANEDKSTQSFQEKLNKIIDAVINFKEEYLYQEEMDSLKLLQNIEQLKDYIQENEQMNELINFENDSYKYQELLNEKRKEELEKLLNHFSLIEDINNIVIESDKENIDFLEKSVSNNLTELKNIVKDSFENKLDKINSIFNNIDGSKGNALNDLRQDIVVNINADFPAATQANEIQLAFDNLVNIASQRAYSTSALRKK